MEEQIKQEANMKQVAAELCLVPTSFWFLAWDPKMEATVRPKCLFGF
jgi:hypothetical protein